MRFISVSADYFALCGSDPEILHKGSNRPHVLLLSLLYKGQRLRFAVPLRSNIPPAAPKSQYFPLPARSTTKTKHRHGLHYIKMFPITKQYQEKFWVGENPDYLLYQRIIEQNEKTIVSKCQEYLKNYENGIRPRFSVDIDAALQKLGIHIS